MSVHSIESITNALRAEYYSNQKPKFTSFPASPTPDPSPKTYSYLTPRIFSKDIIAGKDLNAPYTKLHTPPHRRVAEEAEVPNEAPNEGNNRAEEYNELRYPGGSHNDLVLDFTHDIAILFINKKR